VAKKSNVNPDHYKTAGREPAGGGFAQEIQKRKYRETQARLVRRARKGAQAKTKRRG
jgi:hypothetical protein